MLDICRDIVHIGHGEDYCHLGTTHCTMSGGLGDSSQWLYYNIAGVLWSAGVVWSGGVMWTFGLNNVQLVRGSRGTRDRSG